MSLRQESFFNDQYNLKRQLEARTEPLVIGLVGESGAGKDTTADILVMAFDFWKNAFADPLKDVLLAINPWILTPLENVRLADIVKSLGWEVAKRQYPEIRRLMQRLGTEGVRAHIGENTWADVWERRWEKRTRKHTVASDLRAPGCEVTQLLSHNNNFFDLKSCFFWKIVRPENPLRIAKNHSSESLVDEIQCHLEILNDGTPEILHERVYQALGWTLNPSYDPRVEGVTVL